MHLPINPLYDPPDDGQDTQPSRGDHPVWDLRSRRGIHPGRLQGAPLAGNGEELTVPSRRGLPHGPGRGTFEKNAPMMTVYHQRVTEDETGLTIFEVPVNDGKTLAGRAAEKFEREPRVITDEHTTHKSLGEAGYDRPTVNHS